MTATHLGGLRWARSAVDVDVDTGMTLNRVNRVNRTMADGTAVLQWQQPTPPADGGTPLPER